LLLSVNNIRIIDSFNFLPMSLSAMPKAFGIEDACKGFFPHLFNIKENQTYKGNFPDAFTYSPATMKPSEYDKFMSWYNAQTGKVLFLFIKHTCLIMFF